MLKMKSHPILKIPRKAALMLIFGQLFVPCGIFTGC